MNLGTGGTGGVLSYDGLQNGLRANNALESEVCTRS